VSFQRLDVLPWTELKDLVEESYKMVAAKARIASPKAVKSPANEGRKPKARRARK
jgi:hypothetical protein